MAAWLLAACIFAQLASLEAVLSCGLGCHSIQLQGSSLAVPLCPWHRLQFHSTWMHDTAAAACCWLLPQQVVDFLSTSLGMLDSYAFSKPQLAEFYVHHHFLHFTQHYHKLPTSPASGSAVLCKSHLQVRGCCYCGPGRL